VTAQLCEFARADGFAGFVRLDARDTIAWYWTYLVGVPGVDGIVTVRDHEVRPPRPGSLEIRADGLWAELWCEQPGEHWTFGLEAFGVRLDAAEEALRAGGEIGERVAVGLDIEWELGDIVHGEVLVERNRFVIDAWGRFVDGHELRDDPVTGDEVARVLVPLDDDKVCERTLVRDTSGSLRWSQVITSR
jgi:hypothetical protein